MIIKLSAIDRGEVYKPSYPSCSLDLFCNSTKLRLNHNDAKLIGNSGVVVSSLAFRPSTPVMRIELTHSSWILTDITYFAINL